MMNHTLSFHSLQSKIVSRFSALALAAVLGLAPFSQASAAPLPNLKMKVGIGLGYHLCPERKGGGLPDLQDAFLCSSLAATPVNVELELVNKPAAKPEWQFYEAPYNQTIQFHDIEVKLEALVMFAKFDGQTKGFIDGRLYSIKDGKMSAPVYFRASADGGLDQLSYSSAYGANVPFPLSNGTTGQFAPFVAFNRAQ